MQAERAGGPPAGSTARWCVILGWIERTEPWAGRLDLAAEPCGLDRDDRVVTVAAAVARALGRPRLPEDGAAACKRMRSSYSSAASTRSGCSILR